jgi:RNA polymerase sigma-54 factor
MALSAKLVMRQSQSLVMTPQLLQAIKLLQLPNLELAAYIENELECNPLLERADEVNRDEAFVAAPEQSEAPDGDSAPDWASSELEIDAVALAENLGTEIENSFDADRPASGGQAESSERSDGLSATSWTGAPGAGDGEFSGVDAFATGAETLRDHVARQAAVILIDPVARIIGAALIDALDDAGYVAMPLQEIAEALNAPLEEVEAVLKALQTLEPTGVFARNLAECLSLQLIERNRFDPAMQAQVANLPALAAKDFAALRRVCAVDAEDLSDMITELRRLEPKPGRPFGVAPEQLRIPDVFVSAAPDQSWRIELNSEALPRVLVNETYAANVKRGRHGDADRNFLSTHLQNANWLTKSLEQRARTILKVASEIVRRQDNFLAIGVAGLRPLNLKTVADAIGMHESTVSRVTSNKYMHTPRGLFEMKYFFSTSIAATHSGEAHSAESVRHRIKQMIEAEHPREILSDDVIVARLKSAGVVIARRTVAKYREGLRIPSSVDRRRAKMGAFTPPMPIDQRPSI